MLRCPPGSLRSVQLPLDHQVEMRDTAVCHQHWVRVRVMVAETMCLYYGTQWCCVCGEEEGSKNWPLRNPSDQLSIPHLPRPPRKTYQRDRILTSKVESQWCPVMIGWTGGSDDWQCQKQQMDPAEWELMILNQLLQFVVLQWLREAPSQLNGHSWNLTG